MKLYSMRLQDFGIASGMVRKTIWIVVWGMWCWGCGGADSNDDEGLASTNSTTISDSANSSDANDVGTSVASDGESSSVSESTHGDSDSSSESGSETGEVQKCEGGYTCVASPLPNWSGPIVRMESSDSMILPACGGAFPLKKTDVFDNVQFNPASCTPCKCGKPQGLTCFGVGLSIYENTDCVEPMTASGVVGPEDECKNFQVDGDKGVSWESESATVDVSKAACSPSGGFPSVEDASWGYGQRLCSSVPNNRFCPADQTCVPTEFGNGKAGLCIYQDGDVACPEVDYPVRTVLYKEFVEMRSCSACECSEIVGDYQCDAGIVVYAEADCAGAQSDSIVLPGESCEELDLSGQVAKSGRLVIDAIEGTGQCDPVGGLPTGEVTPSMPVTLCCTL